MGYDDAACAVTTSEFGIANSSVPFWMDNVQCTGSEEALDDCSFSGWGIHSCDHSFNDAGIVCANSKYHFIKLHIFNKCFATCVLNTIMQLISSLNNPSPPP